MEVIQIMTTHVQLGIKPPNGLEQRQQNESDEGALRRRFGDLVPIHERRHGQSFHLFAVALLEELL